MRTPAAPRRGIASIAVLLTLYVAGGEAYLQRYTTVQKHLHTDQLFDGIESRSVGPPPRDFTTAIHSHVHRLMSSARSSAETIAAGALGVTVPANNVTVEMEDLAGTLGGGGEVEERSRAEEGNREEEGSRGEVGSRAEEESRGVGGRRRQLAKTAGPADAVALLKVAQPWGVSFKQRATWKLTNPCSNWFGVTCNPPKTGFSVAALSLPDQGLRGPLASALGSLSSLTLLNLSSTVFDKRNVFTGTIPSTIQQLSNLQILLLSNTGVKGAIPKGIQNLQKLRILGLPGNQLNGSIPPGVTKLSGLQLLDVGFNFLSGVIPPGITKLSKLANFVIFGNSITGLVPPQIGAMPSLTYLVLGSNKLKGSLPSSLGKLANLGVLDVANNRMTGSIPKSLSRLSSLFALALPGNKLSGRLDPSLGRLTSLAILDVSGNAIQGKLPDTMSSLGELSILMASANKLSGPLPAWLGLLTNLQRLELGFNKLTGTIPSSFSALSGLTTLYLPKNAITGTIPDIWTSLKSLVSVDLSFNQLTGKVVLPGPKVAWNVTGNYLLGKGCSRGKSLLNCFTDCKRQRPPVVCAGFCGTTSKLGACAGKGTCFLLKNVPVCKCVAGYQRPKNKLSTCVKIRK